MITNSEISRYMILAKKMKNGSLSISEKSELLTLKEAYTISLKENDKSSVSDEDIARINELSKKFKVGKLSDDEDKELVRLRLAFVLATKKNVASQVNNIDLVDKDGKVENLGEKYNRH